MTGDLFDTGPRTPLVILRTLTLHQPWASLMAWRIKTIETRGWGTSRTGELAIHAAAAWHDYALQACRENRAIAEALAARGLAPEDLPLGKVLAVAELAACRQVAPADPLDWVPPGELSLGGFTVGRYGFVTRNLRPLDPPVPARGAQGFWNWQVPAGVAIPGVTS